MFFEDVIDNMLYDLDELIEKLRLLYDKPISSDFLDEIESHILYISYIVYRYLIDDFNVFKKRLKGVS